MTSRDLSVYDAVHTSLLTEDRLSVLLLQDALRSHRGQYAYMEIGSHLGGSLQPFLRDSACVAVYSIDPRPSAQADERGVSFAYPGNSTKKMLDVLAPTYAELMNKLVTFERDASAVAPAELAHAPDLCCIDGQNTDDAALSDFESCLRLARPDAVVIFAQVQLIFRGFAESIALLRRRQIEHRAYLLPMKLGVIELGQSALWRQTDIHELLATPTAALYVAETLAHYRDGILALKRIPGAQLARSILLRLGLARGLEPRGASLGKAPREHSGGGAT